MTPVALISSPDCGQHDTGWNHPEHVGRLRAIPRALRDSPELFHAILHLDARHATPADDLGSDVLAGLDVLLQAIDFAGARAS